MTTATISTTPTSTIKVSAHHPRGRQRPGPGNHPSGADHIGGCCPPHGSPRHERIQPDRPDLAKLSPCEQVILADTEADLTTTDPTLARSMSTRRAFRGMSPAQILLLTLTLVLLAMIVRLLPASWWGGLTLLTILVVAPGMLLSAIERGQHH